ncbi:hypothetical protein SASPL_134455 [Salvia splendens]|uniref:Uncharacterized protein n=1 Tax=Salvia splendens TaxID=180675 RepID=A0A8X8ZK26_SALSN|nr:hypothetical protein SASPL_134455 [Salvia splendens]
MVEGRQISKLSNDLTMKISEEKVLKMRLLIGSKPPRCDGKKRKSCGNCEAVQFAMHPNLRAKGLKVKHVIRIFLLVAICVWLIHNFKNPQHVESDEKIGRKELRPRVDGVERGGGEEVEVAEESGEVEVEHEQMQDFVDEDDKD